MSDRPELGDRTASGENILDVEGLKMYFPVTRGLRRKVVAYVRAVDDVGFHIKKGETLGLVGESGCGKSTVARCVLRLYKPTEGRITFGDRRITDLSKHEMRPLRKEMQMIFQDPYSSLDPRQTAGSLVGEPLRVHRLTSGGLQYRYRLANLFRMVGLDPSMEDRVPHEFSGGQRQRLSIARALASEPSFVVCDEPISALDVSIQAQIINLLQELQEKLDLTYLFIAHDLSVVRHISDRVAVMYLGRIAEITDCKDLYENPLHPYTKALLSAVPIPDPKVEETRERIILKGDVPSPLNPPTGCSFHPRCPSSMPECSKTTPKLKAITPTHEVACLLFQD